MKFRFRKPLLDDAELILDWRTSPDITRHMYTDVEYDLDKQRAWLERCRTREDYRHFLMLVDERPVGFLCFHNIDWHNKHCSNGSYVGVPGQESQMIGALCTWFIHDYVFYHLSMHKMFTTFMGSNERVIKGQIVNGLRHVGTFKEHILKNDIYHDVEIFELLKTEWDACKRRPFTVDQTLAAFEEW